MNLRKFLFPLSIVYDGITSLRNFAYDQGWKHSKSYNKPVICVGNLSVGGTGKSPMIEYLIELLKKDYKVSVLSRGYKRGTKGYLEVKTTHSSEEVGDEPLQFKEKFPEVTVAVCANRQEGIEKLLPVSEVILLDDGIQHRKVTPYFTILLTPFDDLYVNDLILPAGNLRESKSGAKRADIIVVTKCPEHASYAKLQDIQYKLKPSSHQKVYFSKIAYDTHIYGSTETLPLHYLKDKEFTLVTGIANPKPLLAYLQGKGYKFQHKKYPDHHEFSEAEIERLQKLEIILTTEKDYMRLQSRLKKFALYYLPIKTSVLKEQQAFFNETIFDALENFRRD
ncbi:MAG: tetraacyldisaccharide 4'-kinase [Flavobacteriaceae bacterium]|nr:tetraacyldisaccharide 4'-kinase [Flavobacteriaceae bacterium]